MEVIERGHIFFLYRPRVNEEDPQSLDDVQRMHIVLRCRKPPAPAPALPAESEDGQHAPPTPSNHPAKRARVKDEGEEEGQKEHPGKENGGEEGKGAEGSEAGPKVKGEEAAEGTGKGEEATGDHGGNGDETAEEVTAKGEAKSNNAAKVKEGKKDEGGTDVGRLGDKTSGEDGKEKTKEKGKEEEAEVKGEDTLEHKESTAVPSPQIEGGDSGVKNPGETSPGSENSPGQKPAQEAAVRGEEAKGAQPLLRVLTIGRKMLPDPTKHHGRPRPVWGFVANVTTDPHEVARELRSEEHVTKTRGVQHQPAARVAGQGHYVLLKHPVGSPASNRVHTHLVYRLQVPAKDSEAAAVVKGEGTEAEGEGSSPLESLNVAREASFIIQVKNPLTTGQSSGGHVPQRRTEPFPERLQQKLGSLRWGPADPPQFLDQVNAEFLLIAASDDVEEELGKDVAAELRSGECGEFGGKGKLLQMLVEEEGERLTQGNEGEAAEEASEVLVKPLFEGVWA